MRVFAAGASGAIGSRLVSQLIERGHEVIGTHRSPAGGARLGELGAQPVALDLLDAQAVRSAVLEARPDAIVHQATALANAGFSRHLDRTFAETNRLRTTSTRRSRRPAGSRSATAASTARRTTDAAAATVLALEQGATGVHNVVDYEPAPVREWLPVLADALGSKPPRHFPRWLAKLFAFPVYASAQPRRDGYSDRPMSSRASARSG